MICVCQGRRSPQAEVPARIDAIHFNGVPKIGHVEEIRRMLQHDT